MLRNVKVVGCAILALGIWVGAAWATPIGPPAGTIYLQLHSGETDKLWPGDTTKIDVLFLPDGDREDTVTFSGFEADAITVNEAPTGPGVIRIDATAMDWWFNPSGWTRNNQGAVGDFGPDGDDDWLGMDAYTDSFANGLYWGSSAIHLATITWQAHLDSVVGFTDVDIENATIVYYQWDDFVEDYINTHESQHDRLTIGPPVRLWVVPEPLTVLGIFLGVAGLAGYLRKRKR